MSELSFGQSLWWIVPALLAAALLTWWTYRRTVPALTGAMRWLVPTIRFLTLSTILFLLTEPLIQREESIVTDPILVIAVDESESLSVTGDPALADTARITALRRLLDTVPTDRIPGRLSIVGFGSDVRDISVSGSWADSLLFSQQRTDISRMLQHVQNDTRHDNLGAVLIVSDGQHNSGRNPVFVAERSPVPVLTTVVGDTTLRRDLYVRSVVANDIGYLGTELPVRAVVRADGIDAASVTVSLLIDGVQQDAQTIQISPRTEATVDLSFTADAPGLKRMTVAVTRLPNETTYRNNVETSAIQILDAKKRVLILGSAPGPDITAIRNLLDADTDVDVTTTVFRSASEQYGAPLPDDLGEFDLVILAGYPGARVPSEHAASVASRIKPETGLLFLLARDSDLAKLNRYFGDRLPVQTSTIRTDFLEATLNVTNQGRAHPVLESVDLSQTDWDRMPPVQYNATSWRLNASARLLASARIRGTNLPDPMLAVRQDPSGRSAVLLAAGTWRWHNLPEDLESYDAVWPDLLRNAVTWLTVENDDRRVRVQPSATTFAASDRIRFSGQVYDESLQPVSDAAVQIDVRSPDGRVFPFAMDAAGNGRYTLQTDALPGGSYSYQATASSDGVELGRDEGSFVVGDLALEFKETRADPQLMRQIAARAGGSVIAPADLSRLDEILGAMDGFQPKIEYASRETELWRRYVFLAVLVVLLTLEWFLRKRNGLV